MDFIRDGIAKFADNTSFGIQQMARTFGFLPDGKELVLLEPGDGGLVFSFSDRAEEGWSGISLNIPSDAMFDQAHNGLLTRQAQWILRIPMEEVVRHLTTKNEGFPPPDEKRKRGVGFKLAGHVEIGLLGSGEETKGPVCFLFVRQRREPDSIKDAVIARARSLSDRWGTKKANP